MINNKQKKILVIEDDSITQKLYHDVLTKEGYEVIQVFDGREGRNTVKSVHPDLIILDLMLPGGVNGFDILEIVKSDPTLKNIPVMVFTNLDSEQKVAMSIGASDYIIKSNISVEQIVAKVKEHLQ